MRTEHVSADRDALFSALHAWCVNALRDDLQSMEKVSCYLSGGSTPLPLYTLLAATALPWHRICPALADERWVAADDPASNEGQLRKIFTPVKIFQQQLTGMKSDHASASAAEADCNRRYLKLPKPASFCLLGMGNDGHTASLFPHAQGLDTALDSEQTCVAITALPSPVTGAQTERMSLSLSGILQSRRIVLLFTGQQKWEIYQQALHSPNPTGLPVSAVLHQHQTAVEVFYCP